MTVRLYRDRDGEVRYGWHWLCMADDRGRTVVINMTRPQLAWFGLRCLWTAIWGG